MIEWSIHAWVILIKQLALLLSALGRLMETFSKKLEKVTVLTRSDKRAAKLEEKERLVTSGKHFLNYTSQNALAWISFVSRSRTNQELRLGAKWFKNICLVSPAAGAASQSCMQLHSCNPIRRQRQANDISSTTLTSCKACEQAHVETQARIEAQARAAATSCAPHRPWRIADESRWRQPEHHPHSRPPRGPGHEHKPERNGAGDRIRA